jgi:hypothetical protein
MLIKGRKITENVMNLEEFKKKSDKLLTESYYYVTLLHDGFRVLIGKNGVFCVDGTQIKSIDAINHFASVIDMASEKDVVFDGIVASNSYMGTVLRKHLLTNEDFVVPPNLTFYVYDIIEMKDKQYAERVTELTKYDLENTVMVKQNMYGVQGVKSRVDMYIEAEVYAVLIQPVYGHYNNMSKVFMVVKDD